MDMKVRPEQFPDTELSRVAWPAVISLSLGVFGLVTAEFLPVSLLTPISEDLGVSVGTAGQSMTMTAVLAAFAGPGIVIGTARFNRKSVLLFLTATLVLSGLISSFASNIEVLFLARLLLGVGLGGFWAMSVGLAIRLAPARSLPRVMAVIMAGVSLATVSAAPLGAWIGANYGWRTAFLLASVVGVLALALQALAIPSLPPKGSASVKTMFAVLKRPAIRVGLGTMLLAVAGHFAGFTYIRPFLERGPQFDINAISQILLAFGIAGFIGNLLGGALSARSTRLSMTLSAAGISLSTLVLATAGTYPIVAIIAVSVWGLAFGALPVSCQSFISQEAAEDAESAGALMLTAFQIAISSGAVLGGLLINGQGPTGILLFASVATLAAAALVGLKSRARSRW